MAERPFGWRSVTAAQRLSKDEAEVYNLRGFLLVAQNQTGAAVEAFRHAVRLNDELGEPHLGLGIAYMRQGKPTRARGAVSNAVLLQPRRSLYRSYWAKLLYQLGHFDKARQMIALAKVYDPQDPTPWLYESLLLRDGNRPTEAVQALQRAIALNDNRAVYRSRFLLDQDLAVRSADLSQLYSQLGLSVWARNKAFAAIKKDYTIYSAHAMLAGALSEQPDRAWAQASEALLSRLLQPGNVNSFNTYNEYTALFEQPAINGSVAAGLGNRDQSGAELITYGAIPDWRVAFSAGGFLSNTDGWRGSNKERVSDVAGVAKWDLSLRDSLLVTASHARTNLRDELLTRSEYDFPADPNDSSRVDSTRLELGYRHRRSPKSNLLLFFSWLDSNIEQFEQATLPGADVEQFAKRHRDRQFHEGAVQAARVGIISRCRRRTRAQRA